MVSSQSGLLSNYFRLSAPDVLKTSGSPLLKFAKLSDASGLTFHVLARVATRWIPPWLGASPGGLWGLWIDIAGPGHYCELYALKRDVLL
jgi:hypothetical protein